MKVLASALFFRTNQHPHYPPRASKPQRQSISQPTTDEVGQLSDSPFNKVIPIKNISRIEIKATPLKHELVTVEMAGKGKVVMIFQLVWINGFVQDDDG
ncbi:MAG: hypothetical protein ACJAXE_002339 [Neolewinella sp.]|jgi:hypothetical protein